MIKFFRHMRESLLLENKTSKYFKYALGEIILVVIGILIALQINNWNEDKKIQNNITTSLNLLKDEIEINKMSISSVKDYHIMIRDTLQKINMSIEEKNIESRLGFWKGMRTPRLRNAAFQTTIQSGISREFNPFLLSALNNLYTYQDSYNQFNNSSSQIFFNADFTDIKSIKKTMRLVEMTMNDLYYYEKELQESFIYCLKQIDSIYPLK